MNQIQHFKLMYIKPMYEHIPAALQESLAPI